MARTTINNGDSGLVVRTALNAMFTELYASRWVVLAASGVAVPHTGDTAETVLGTVAIPAGAIGPNGMIRVTTLWSVTNSANNKVLRARLGGIGGTQFFSTTQTTVATYNDPVRLIQNRNSQSSQIGRGASTTGAGSTAAVVTGTIDTSAAQDLVFTGTLANSGETVTLESFLVELSYAP